MDIQILKIEQLNEPIYADYTKVYIRRENKIRKIFGNFTWHVAIDNTFITELLLYKKQGGEYRKLPYKLPRKGICDFANDDKIFYPDIAQHSDHEVPFKCPQPIGVYALRGLSIQLDKLPDVIIHSGDYAGELVIQKDDIQYLRLRLYCSIIRI